MFVIGENERNAGRVSVWKRGEGDLGSSSIQAMIEQMEAEIRGMKM